MTLSQKAKARLRKHDRKQKRWNKSCRLHHGPERPYRRGRSRCSICGKRLKAPPYLGGPSELFNDSLIAAYLDPIRKQLNTPTPLFAVIGGLPRRTVKFYGG